MSEDTKAREFPAVEFTVQAYWCGNPLCSNGHEGDAACVLVQGFWCNPCIEIANGSHDAESE